MLIGSETMESWRDVASPLVIASFIIIGQNRQNRTVPTHHKILFSVKLGSFIRNPTLWEGVVTKHASESDRNLSVLRVSPGVLGVIQTLFSDLTRSVLARLARRVDSLESVYMRKSWLVPQVHPILPTEWPYRQGHPIPPPTSTPHKWPLSRWILSKRQ